MILLDTDVMIDLLRQYPPAVAWLDSLGDEEIVLPGYLAVSLGLPLHTFNQRHYAAILNLRTVQPYAK